jgi:signal transduction histidine kinase
MRVSIKAKQVAGVTTIVALAVAVLSGVYLGSLARILLEESEARGSLLAHAIYQRAHEVVESADGRDPAQALRTDSGLRSILEASAYDKRVTYATIVDVTGAAIAHSDADLVGHAVPPADQLSALLKEGAAAQIRAIRTPGGRTFEISQPLLLGTAEFGSIRIGVSTLLIRSDFYQPLRRALIAVLIAIGGAILVATLLAQLFLRPIHVIRSGLTRLGRGEFGVNVDLPLDDEFGELGQFFNTVSAQLSADRPHSASQDDLAPAMDQLEDAIGIVDRKGVLLFANKAMREALPDDAAGRRLDDLLPDGHPYLKIIEDARATRQPRGPLVAMLTQPTPGERLLVANPVETGDKRAIDVILISRNLEYLSQVQSAVSYSRKLAERSRRSARQSAGVAHEVKNPLNATVIHLELLKEQLAASGAPPSAMDHVAIIAAQMRRLDEVVQEFLRFIRPEDLKLESVQPSALIDAIRPIVSAEAERHGIELRIENTNGLPDVRVDSGMMQQALLNLALNACQAMPRGGRLSLSASSASGKRIEIVCQDTGPGIKPEHLDKIFDLYFTTKEKGSGIGLSMVDRAVQLHDGEIDVESIPGRTTFRVLLPQASSSGS